MTCSHPFFMKAKIDCINRKQYIYILHFKEIQMVASCQITII